MARKEGTRVPGDGSSSPTPTTPKEGGQLQARGRVTESRLAALRLGATRRLGPYPARVRCACARLHNRSVLMCSMQLSDR
jgi:hypothetical protein